MTSVWILTAGDEDFMGIVAVFSDKPKAEAFAAARHPGLDEDFTIAEWPLDPE